METRQLPKEPPQGWVHSSPVFATHYLTHYLMHPGREGDQQFADLWHSWTATRARQVGGALSAKTAKAKELGFEKFITLAKYEPAIKSSWCSDRGLIEISAPDTTAGSKRNDLDRVLVDLNISGALMHLDPRGYIAAKPYSRAEAALHRMREPEIDKICNDLLDHPTHGDLFALAFILRSTPKQSQRPSADVLQAHRVCSRYARLLIYKAEKNLRAAMLKQGHQQT